MRPYIIPEHYISEQDSQGPNGVLTIKLLSHTMHILYGKFGAINVLCNRESEEGQFPNKTYVIAMGIACFYLKYAIFRILRMLHDTQCNAGYVKTEKQISEDLQCYVVGRISKYK